MPVHQFRFELVPSVLVLWLVSWGAAFGVYLGLAWPIGAPPGWWWPQVPVVGLVSFAVLVACTLHHWRRILDRSPQLELYPTFLRAKQLGDDDILWADVRHIRSLDRFGGAVEIGAGARNNVLVLDVADRGEVELNLDGMGVPAQHVLELIWKVQTPNAPRG